MAKRQIIGLATWLVLLHGTSAMAEEARNRTDYTIALSGLPLAKAVFNAVRNKADYEVEAEIVSTGIANVIAETQAEMRSSGRLEKGELRPERFYFRYRYGKKNRLFDTAFKGGDVVSSIIEPKPRVLRRKNWIPIRPEHLKAVTDPVAGLILPGDTNPCRPKIAVYDGEARLDISLTHKGAQHFSTTGFEGEAIVCRLRYEPKSGYKSNHADINYIRKLKDMEIWFAKSALMNVYAPVFLSVPTKYGTLTMRATRFGG